jgi:hypothetical protein
VAFVSLNQNAKVVMVGTQVRPFVVHWCHFYALRPVLAGHIVERHEVMHWQVNTGTGAAHPQKVQG